MSTKNRLQGLLQDFTSKYELPCKPDENELWSDVGLPDGNDLVFVGFAFAKNEDSYDYMAALGSVTDEQKLALSIAIMQGEPIRGITERIDESGKYIVLGGRDGLSTLADADVMKGMMDDLARVAEANEQYRNYRTTLE
mgnify:CR=1 FL=1